MFPTFLTSIAMTIERNLAAENAALRSSVEVLADYFARGDREAELHRARIEGLKEALAMAEEWAASTVAAAIRARIEELERETP